eukprot:gene3067-3835_t
MNNDNNNNSNNIPFTWLTNLPQISDSIHELPIPSFRNDSSIYLINSNNFANTIAVLQNAENPNNVNHQHSKEILSKVNRIIGNTSVSNIKLRSDIKPFQNNNNINNHHHHNQSSPLLQTLYNHIPVLLDSTNINNNNHHQTPTTPTSHNNNNNNNYQQPSIQEQLQKFALSPIGRGVSSSSSNSNKENLIVPFSPINNNNNNFDENSLPSMKDIIKDEQTPVQKLFNLILQFFDLVKDGSIADQESMVNTEYIENLQTQIVSCSKTGLHMSIDPEQFARLIQYLIKFSSGKASTVSLSYNESDPNFKDQYNTVEFSLSCGILSLNILTMPEISQQLVELLDDELVEILTSIKYQVFENIIGHIDPSFKTFQKQDKEKQEETTKNNGVSEVFERMSILIQNSHSSLDSSFVSILLDFSLPCLFLQEGNTDILQLSVVNLCRIVYSLYPQHRQYIIDEILKNISKLYQSPTSLSTTTSNSSTTSSTTSAISKRIKRSYKISSDKSIQIISALLIQLIQSSVNVPKASLDPSEKPFSLRDCKQVSTSIILFFVDKFSGTNKTEEAEFKIILENFIQDVLTTLSYPEWPASNFFLHILCATIIHMNKNAKMIENNFRMICIDLIGSILTKIKFEVVSSKQEESTIIPMSILYPPSPSASSTPPTTISSSKQHNYCLCNKFGPESYTIKCEDCGNSYHDLCAPDYSKSTHGLTEQWFCIPCRVRKQITTYVIESKIIDSNTKNSKKKSSSSSSNSTKVNGASTSTTSTPAPTTAATTRGASTRGRGRGRGKKSTTASKRKQPEEEEQEEEEKEKEKVEEEKSVSTGPIQSTTIEEFKITDKEVLQQLILNYLTMKSHGERWVSTAKHFLIASWLDSQELSTLDCVPIRQFFLSQWDYKENVFRGGLSTCGKTFICENDEAIRLFKKLSVKTSVFLQSNNLLYSLLSMLSDPSTKARAKAMKSFTSIIEADPSVLAEEFVHNSIRTRFMDDSISVREHTVDLIGKYILTKPELTWRYIDLICERITDKGISVRKRVVKTIHEICLLQRLHPKIPEICRILVSRINDEDSIRDLIIKTFQELWFSPESSVSNNSSSTTTTTPKLIHSGESPTTTSSTSLFNQNVLKVKQIIEVTKQLADNDNWFVELISKMVNTNTTASTTVKKESTATTKKKQKESVQSFDICNQICSTLIEMLVSLEEKKLKDQSEIVGVFKTLYLFCQVNPSFLIPYTNVLHPYLKAPTDRLINNDEAPIYIAITHIFEKVLPMVENSDLVFLQNLENDLLELISKQLSSIVHSSMRCLCLIIEKCSRNYKFLEDLLFRYVQLLQTCQTKTKGEIIRTLYTLGLLIRYYNFEQRPFESTGNSPVLSLFKSSSSEVINTIVPLVSKLFSIKDREVVSKSLEAIGNICISSPVILNKDNIKDIFNRAFGMTTDSKIKETILNIFNGLLEKESKSNILSERTTDEIKKESKDEKDNAQQPQKAIVSMHIDQHSESLVMAIQRYFPNFVKLLLDPEERVRTITITTVNHIINQGIINPVDCVPSIVALLTDPNPEISEKSFTTLNTINKKFTSQLSQRILESIKLTFKFHKNIKTQSPYNGVIKGITRFYTLYKNSKSSRTNFLKQILSEFDLVSSKELKHKKLYYFRFLFEILACLPYTNMDEVYTVLQTIDKTLSLNATFIQSKIQKALNNKKNAKKNKKETNDDEEDEEEGDEKKVKAKKEKKSEEDLLLHQQFILSMVLTLMIQLKKFLLKTYSITKDRMKAYLENDGKESDKLMVTFSDSILLTENNYPFSKIIKDSDLYDESTQRTHFIQFKNLLKEDDKDEFSIPVKQQSNSKKKNTAAAAGSTSETSPNAAKKRRKAKEPKRKNTKSKKKKSESESEEMDESQDDSDN